MAHPPISEQARSVKLGLYEHFKGNKYMLHGVVWHSETEEEMALYQHLYGDFSFWVRPLNMFLEEVEYQGKRMPRFKYIGE